MTERVITRYVCDLCGAEYDTKDECAECESGHTRRSKTKIRDMSFEPKHRIPFMVWIEFDGQKIPYMACPGRE